MFIALGQFKTVWYGISDKSSTGEDLIENFRKKRLHPASLNMLRPCWFENAVV